MLRYQLRYGLCIPRHYRERTFDLHSRVALLEDPRDDQEGGLRDAAEELKEALGV